MLRAKAVKHRSGTTRLRDKVLSATDVVGRIAGIPVVSQLVNATNRSRVGRAFLEKTLGVDRTAPVPGYHSRSFRKRFAAERADLEVRATAETTGKVAIFVTCYGNRNDPQLVTDLAAVLRHNGIAVTLAGDEKCCGMPKLELGDLDAVARLKETNIPALADMVDAGFDIVAPIPSCVLMYKQELPLLFPDDADSAQSAGSDVRSFRVSVAQSQGGTSQHRLQGRTRTDLLSRCLSPARAEHGAEDA